MALQFMAIYDKFTPLIVVAVTIFVNVIVTLSSREKRGFHDRIAGTVVLRRKVEFKEIWQSLKAHFSKESNVEADVSQETTQDGSKEVSNEIPEK